MTYTVPHAIVAAVSREYGVDLVQVYKHSINKMKFKIFLQELRDKYPFDDMLLVMDNLSVHKTREVRNRMDEMNIMYAFTPAYSPAYNGIEEVFSMAKRKIKEKRYELIMQNKKECLREIIF